MPVGGGKRGRLPARLTVSMGGRGMHVSPQLHRLTALLRLLPTTRELYDEIGERLTKEDWEKYDILEGDFMGDGQWVRAFACMLACLLADSAM